MISIVHHKSYFLINVKGWRILILSYLFSLEENSLACLTQRLRENIDFSGILPPLIFFKFKVVGLCFENCCQWINTRNLMNARGIFDIDVALIVSDH